MFSIRSPQLEPNPCRYVHDVGINAACRSIYSSSSSENVTPRLNCMMWKSTSYQVIYMHVYPGIRVSSVARQARGRAGLSRQARVRAGLSRQARVRAGLSHQARVRAGLSGLMAFGSPMHVYSIFTLSVIVISTPSPTTHHAVMHA